MAKNEAIKNAYKLIELLESYNEDYLAEYDKNCLARDLKGRGMNVDQIKTELISLIGKP